jgi:hypothetical protein
VELLAILAADPEKSIAERAQNVLLSLPIGSFQTALAHPDTDPRFFTFCAQYMGEKPGVADALAKNLACPAGVVARVARHLSSEGIQALLDNLERLISDPALLPVLTQSQGASAAQQALLGEIHDKHGFAEKDLEEAAALVEPDPVKRETLTKKIMRMNVVERLTLALKGDREARMLLIRDPNKLVQKCVLQSPRLSDTEVESFAAMGNVSEEVLRTISLTRKFMKSYAIAKNLVGNPKTPIDISLHILPRLTATDLKHLTTNKNIPDTLRSTAIKLHRQRNLSGQSGR